MAIANMQRQLFAAGTSLAKCGVIAASLHDSLVQSSAPLGQTLLLVEDNEDNRIIYSTVLRHIGYEVVEAVDGVQAIALARSVLPDLILMDLSLPQVDGWEATKILRQDPLTRDIPIIALTAHAMADDRERAQAIGFTSYLAKPVEPRAVAAEVQRWIGGGGAGAPAPAS